jgi:dynein heavy chain
MAVLILIFAAILSVQVVAAAKTPLVTYGNGREFCLSTELQNVALQNVRKIHQYRSLLPQCGEGIWYRVAHLNMTDPSQQCPSAWREYNTSQFRACGRPDSSGASRPSKVFPISHQYSRVCGRVIGIQIASPDAFHPTEININGNYIDGVSITHGSPRHHIWSYMLVLSVRILQTLMHVHVFTPMHVAQPQSFVGSNYYCESGNPTLDWDRVFPNDKLWDGEQCSHEGTCCTGTNTPPCMVQCESQ